MSRAAAASRTFQDHRLTVAALLVGYGVVMAVANARNSILTNDFTRRDDWLLFGGDSGFPGDFGRNVFAGSVALAAVIVGLAALVALWGGTSRARPVAVVTAMAAVLLVLTYRDSGNLLAAKPSAAAVLLATALYLFASSLPTPSTGEDAPKHRSG